MCWNPGWFCMCCGIDGGGECDSGPGEPMPASSSSSSSPPPLSAKSAGPLCSCAPPYCVFRYQSASIINSSTASSCTYVLEPPNCVIDITRRVFIQFLVVAKYYHSDIDGTEDGELVRLFEKTAFALEKGSIGISSAAAGARPDATSAQRRKEQHTRSGSYHP